MIRSTWQFHAPFLTSFLLLSGARPQEGPDKPEPVMVRLDTVIGADVVSAKGERLGKIDDLLVDPVTGRIDELVLAVAKTLELGDRKVLIRWKRVTWDAEHKTCRHDTNREELQQAPQFKPSDDPAHGPTGDAGAAEASDDQGKQEQRDRTPAPPAPPRLASKLAELRVIAGKDDLGTAAGVFTEVRSGQLAFVTVTLGDVVGIGGSTYAIPWRALTVRTQDTRSQLVIADMNRKHFEGAPRIEGKNDLASPLYRGRLYRYFNVRLPDYEADRELMAKVARSARVSSDGR